MKARSSLSMATLMMLVLASAGPARASSPPEAAGAAADRTFVVMVFDGFSPEYIAKYPTPAFDRMRIEGAWSHAMDQAFPTISLIGGVTISTGCWPERHGIVTNLFIDPVRGFYDHSSDAAWLTGCEHLHVAAERQGVRTAALGWYGRYHEDKGSLSSYGPEGERSYSEYPDDIGRTAQLIEQIARAPGDRPRMILAYFKGPDSAGHFEGMDADATRAAVVASDRAVGDVLAAIDAQPDASEIQLLVTTDHGMMPVETVVNIQRILRRHDIEARAVSTGTTSFLYFEPSPETGRVDAAAVARAAGKLGAYEEFDVVRRDAQPAGWHLGRGPRVGELIVSAKPPYFIEDPELWPWFLGWLPYIGPDFLPASGALKATHGYPTGTPGVEGILYTRGSAFEPGREVPRVRAIDIHPTVMRVLGLEPGRPVDGAVEQRLLR